MYCSKCRTQNSKLVAALARPILLAQKAPHHLHVVIKLIAANAVAGIGDLYYAQLRHQRLERGGIRLVTIAPRVGSAVISSAGQVMPRITAGHSATGAAPR